MITDRPGQPPADTGRAAALRALPAVGRLVHAMAEVDPDLPAAVATRAAREEVAAMRERLLRGEGVPEGVAAVVARCVERARSRRRSGLTPVINATGVVVHTNLGRAPLHSEAVEAVLGVAGGYCDLELDLRTGRRGRRGAALHERLATLVGAEAGLAVNNNAAAVWLALGALARGREVLVSRGELVEIGGSFRLPEIFAASGARMREVGTTNRTRAEDYAAALGSGDVALLLKVHRGNFRQVGYTAEAEIPELAHLARGAGVSLVYDLGGGLLRPLPSPPPGWDEPDVASALAGGADLVCFSGDKLFGGPQAGIAVGKAALIEALARDPVYRMLRLDKLTAAALLATVALHEAGRGNELPVNAAVLAPPGELRRRASRIARALKRRLGVGVDVRLDVVPAAGRVGGGAAPEIDLPGHAIRIAGDGFGPHDLLEHLRGGDPPVVARADDGAVWVDPRGVRAAEEEALVRALSRAISVLGAKHNGR